MKDIIKRGYVNKVSENSDTALIDENCWYIPHHGVYHPKKPDKIRVVVDCSADMLEDHWMTNFFKVRIWRILLSAYWFDSGRKALPLPPTSNVCSTKLNCHTATGTICGSFGGQMETRILSCKITRCTFIHLVQHHHQVAPISCWKGPRMTMKNSSAQRQLTPYEGTFTWTTCWNRCAASLKQLS